MTAVLGKENVQMIKKSTFCPKAQQCATAGPSSLGVPGVPWHTQILADQLTLFQPGGTDYAHLITTGTPGFSDLPTALHCKIMKPLNLRARTL